LANVNVRPIRPQQHRLKWPLTPEQVEGIDEMLETLFKATRELQQGVRTVSEATGAVVAAAAAGLLAPGDSDSNDSIVLSIPGAAGLTGSAGAAGIAGPGVFFPDDSVDEQYPLLPVYDVGRVTTSLVLPGDPSTAQNGVIYRGNTLAANRFLHTFADPVNVSNGRNLFLGVGAGSFTVSTGGGSADLASSNLGIGYNVLQSLTTGYGNIIIGESSGALLTTGFQNVGIGRRVLEKITGASSIIAIGYQAFRELTTGTTGVAIGFNAGLATTTGSNNVYIGSNTGTLKTTSQLNVIIGPDAFQTSGNSDNNVGIGRRALFNAAAGTGQNTAIGSRAADSVTTDDNCTFLGYFADRNGGSAIVNSIAIGALAKVSASNTCVIGTSALVATLLNGSVGIQVAAPTAVLHLKAGTATASTAPLKFNSGTLLTTAEAGAVEFLTDAYYGTITTGAARKTFAFLESPAFTTPNIGAANGASLSLSNTINLIATGGAATAGTATLVAGTVTVNTTAMTATALLFTQRKTAGGTVGFQVTYTQVNGTSFTINSDSALDTSTFSWMIVETH
jgi:hypothetical protein